MIPSLRNINEYPNASANQVKASKYQGLLDCLMPALKGTPLSALKREWKAIKGTEQEPLERLTAYRDFYYRVLPQFRNEVESCQEGAYKLFTGNVMNMQSKELIQLLTQNAAFDGLNLLETLKKTKEQIDLAPDFLKTHWFNSLVKSGLDWMDYRFSPLNSGNPPQKFPFVTFFGGKLKLLAHGTPTIQDGPAVIDPLFIGFLRGLAARSERYLYISNQNGLNSENARNHLIIELQEQEEFKDNFIALTCSKDSYFYHGAGFPLPNSEFQERLHQQFFTLPYSESGCYIPPSLNMAEKGRQLIELLGELLLGEEPNLQEQLAMIDFFYALLASLVAYESEADFISFTCKDGIDRGMESLSEFLVLWLVVSEFELDSQQAIEIFTETLFTRSYWVRKRSINGLRFNRFVANASLFLQKTSIPGKKSQFTDKLLKIIPLEGKNVVTVC